MMLLLMPLDDWFLGVDLGKDDPTVKKAIDAIRSWSSPIGEVWRFEEELPEGLRELYGQLNVDSVKHWCKASREWESIGALSWNTLLLLPFATVTARIAALYLKALAEERWPRKDVTIEWCQFDPLIACNKRELVGRFAVMLWGILYRHPPLTAALNVTACAPELAMASMLIASLPEVPVYCWSASLKQMLHLSDWGRPFRNDRERELLKNLLNGVNPPDTRQEHFSSWRWVIGEGTLTPMALVLQEWFEWRPGPGEDFVDV